MTPPPIDVLPRASLLVGDEQLLTSSGGLAQHRYAATGIPTLEFPLAGEAEVNDAVQAARDVFPGWNALPRNIRRQMLLRVAALLREHSHELATITVVENGTPLSLATHTPEMAADLFEYNAGWSDKFGGTVEPTWPMPALDYTVEEPYGVVGIIIPWNGPLASIGMVIAPALAAGNCVVFKPPELAPWTSIRFGELVQKAGIPPGVVNILPGGAPAGEALTNHPGIDKLHFTGSGVTAAKVLAGAQANLTPVCLELGGKSATLIFADADLPAAVQNAIGAIVQVSGQVCLSGSRLIVEDSVYNTVIDMVERYLKHLPFGDPLIAETLMGPVVSETAADRIMAMIERARADARLVTGGHRLDGDFAGGYFISPTVLADVDNDSYIAQTEVFGPVLAVLRFSDVEQAVSLANGTPYGLAAYVWTKDIQRAHRLAAELTVGNVWINGYFGIPGSAPFGGVKKSGYGRIGGREGIREFTKSKNVWVAM